MDKNMFAKLDLFYLVFESVQSKELHINILNGWRLCFLSECSSRQQSA